MTTPSVGAIRWDAWYSAAPGAIANATAISLQDADLQPFAPVHYISNSPHSLSVPAVIPQSVMDNEIDVAVANGLNYWAFLMYNPVPGPDYANGLINGFNLYQSSSIKGNMPFSCMAQVGLLGSTGNFSAQVAQYVGYFQQSNYFKTLSNRPLLYILWSASDLATYWGGSLSNFAAMITALRNATTAGGLGTPFITVLNGAETSVYNGIGADAISAYTAPLSSALNESYPAFDLDVQAYWVTLAATGAPIVPIAMSGWAPIGRIRRPPEFQATQINPRIGLATVRGRPTAAQFKSHIASARAYVTANPSICPANTILTYSWNECDEGNPTCPTIGNPAGMAYA